MKARPNSYQLLSTAVAAIVGTGNVISAPYLYHFTLNGKLTGSSTSSVAGEWAVRLGGDNSGSASAAWVLNNGRMVNSNNSSPVINLGSLSAASAYEFGLSKKGYFSMSSSSPTPPPRCLVDSACSPCCGGGGE
ncbi:MAG: hypothetical protein EAZ81_10045 [Verrucomicrobia bacterium]|jgi:hypothetical protein|nr:MAG: hypothetical protein EAZ81_10045 [Verrucomicrobiota bacterium]